MTPTMTASLIRLARRQWLTPLSALRLCGCLSLSQRMGEIARDGANVLKKWHKLPNGKRVRAYRIAGSCK